MSSRRKVFWAMMAVFAVALGRQAAAQPIFENNTPVGFSPSDSLTTSVFVTNQDINILVDLNEGANSTNPVIGNFQKVEKSVPFFTSASTAGYMSQALAVDDNGTIHRAWIQQRGTTDLTDATSTPVYGVVYAKSINGGQSFSDTISVSGTLRFDALTTSFSMGGSFSTLDLVVNSKGNPRVVYAFDNSPDGRNGGSGTAAGVHQFHGATRQFDNIFFNYSNDGGNTWLPSNDAVVINDVVTTGAHRGGLKCAFPRAAVTSTDDIFIVYQADLGGADGTAHDIRLAKVDEDSLKGGSAQAVRIGKAGTVGSYGGVLVAPDVAAGDITTTPDIAVGDDNVLHIVYFNNTDDQVRHKTLPAEDWTDLSGFGWAPGAAGANVGGFDDDLADNQGMDMFNSTAIAAHVGFSANARGAVHLFPTVVVDKARSPDRVYVFWKYTDAAIAAATTVANDENIAYAAYNYDGATGGSAAWGSRQFAFPQGTDGSIWQAAGGGLFQNASRYQIQDDWAYVDRVAAAVDERIPGSRGDVHVVFSGGGSQSGAAPLTAGYASATGGTGIAGNLYYTRFDGTEWELPQVLATARHTVTTAPEDHEDGVLAQHRALLDPDLALISGEDNVYLTFVGGCQRWRAPRSAPRPTGLPAHPEEPRRIQVGASRPCTPATSRPCPTSRSSGASPPTTTSRNRWAPTSTS